VFTYLTGKQHINQNEVLPMAQKFKFIRIILLVGFLASCSSEERSSGSSTLNLDGETASLSEEINVTANEIRQFSKIKGGTIDSNFTIADEETGFNFHISFGPDISEDLARDYVLNQEVIKVDEKASSEFFNMFLSDINFSQKLAKDSKEYKTLMLKFYKGEEPFEGQRGQKIFLMQPTLPELEKFVLQRTEGAALSLGRVLSEFYNRNKQ